MNVIIGRLSPCPSKIFYKLEQSSVGEIHCVGSETELLECSHSAIGIQFCSRVLSDIPDIAISCNGGHNQIMLYFIHRQLTLHECI